MSLAENLTMFPVNESDLTGAVAGVYKHKIQEKAKYLTILYTKVSKNNIILTSGESISVGFLNNPLGLTESFVSPTLAQVFTST